MSKLKDEKKINIFLDLDQSIISGEVLPNNEEEIDEDDDEEIYDIEKHKKKAMKFDFHNMENYYVIFARPGLQSFLDFLFKHFNVSVWTAASKDYALFIIDKIIIAGHKDRKLDYVFFNYHCKASDKLTGGTKSLSIMWDLIKDPKYNKNNTYILDDYDEVFNTQPDNTIIAKPFHFTEEGSENDDFLEQLKEKFKKLKKDMEKGKNEKVISVINDGISHS